MSNSSQRETARDQSIGLRLGTGLNISPQTTFVLNGVTAYLSSETSRDKSSKSHFCHQTLAGFVAFWRIGSRRYTGRPWRVRSRRFSAEAKRWPSSTRKYRVYAVGFPVNPTRLGFCSADTESTKTAVTKPTSSGNSIGAGGGTEKHLRICTRAFAAAIGSREAEQMCASRCSARVASICFPTRGPPPMVRGRRVAHKITGTTPHISRRLD